MGETVKSIFSKPKPQGPDPELIRMQKEQSRLVSQREAEERRRKKEAQQVLDAQGGNAGFQTLFDAETGITTLGG